MKNHRTFRDLIFVALSACLLLSCSLAMAVKGASVIDLGHEVTLTRISDSFLIHTSRHEFKGFGKVDSNGLVFISKGHAIVVDTPVTENETGLILDYLRDEMGLKVSFVIPGHYHSDCLGGLGLAHRRGISSIGNVMTRIKCRELGLPIPEIGFSRRIEFDFHGSRVCCAFFGGGHTADNMVVWFPDSGVLFGGCLIKSLDARGMGNTAEAVMDQWKNTILKIKRELPGIRLVIPGHGQWGDSKLLDHTADLVDQWFEKKKASVPESPSLGTLVL